MTKPQCAYRKPDGTPCQAHPLRDGKYCFFHDPEHAAEAQEAHRMGGMRRKREATVGGAFDFEGLTTIPQIRRLLEVAVYEVLSGVENAIPRARTIVALAMAAEKLLRTGELEEDIKALKAAVFGRSEQPRSAFDASDILADPFPEEDA